jgi:hypothetical protein
MAVRISALDAGRPLPPGRFLVLVSVKGWVDPRSIVRLEGLGQMKIQWSHRESNPRPSGLYHSASTNYATACPWLYTPQRLDRLYMAQWAPGALSAGVKRPGSEAEHSFLPCAEAKNDGAIPPLPIRLHNVPYAYLNALLGKIHAIFVVNCSVNFPASKFTLSYVTYIMTLQFLRLYVTKLSVTQERDI